MLYVVGFFKTRYTGCASNNQRCVWSVVNLRKQIMLRSFFLYLAINFFSLKNVVFEQLWYENKVEIHSFCSEKKHMHVKKYYFKRFFGDCKKYIYLINQFFKKYHLKWLIGV